jgi:hypothetical protein
MRSNALGCIIVCVLTHLPSLVSQESVGTEEAENLTANLRKASSVTLPGVGLLAAHARKR